MDKEAIEKILTLAPPTQLFVDGRHYSDKELNNISAPLPDAINVHTLTGIVDLVNSSVEGIGDDATTVSHSYYVLHVVSPTEVQLIARACDKWGRRITYVQAELQQRAGFAFGNWLDHERFLIGVMANFTEEADREYLIRVASNLTNERVVTSLDDGVSQQVGLRTGASLKAQETVRNRVMLAPYRTFREVQQPVSEFIFRVRQDRDEIPSLSLHEADGGAWQITAMETIARYMRAALKDVTVVS
jgi:hypothetical protein